MEARFFGVFLVTERGGPVPFQVEVVMAGLTGQMMRRSAINGAGQKISRFTQATDSDRCKRDQDQILLPLPVPGMPLEGILGWHLWAHMQPV